jgi:predicted TIM-barrel fold metal-dependent hydrolase
MRRVGSLVPVALLLGGCCEPQHPKVEPTFQRQPLLRAETEWERSLPIIDIHAHMFNGRYLPLTNIALGKRDKYWFTQLFPDPMVVAAAQYINDMTVLSGDREGPLDVAGTRAHENRALENAARTSGVPAKDLGTRPAMTGLKKIVRTQTRSDLRAALRRPDDQTLTPEERRALRCLGLFGEVDFLAAMVLSDDRRSIAYREDFRLKDRQVLTVCHMMDLGPVYAQEPEPGQLLAFDEQIRRMDLFQQKPDDIRIYFVAYNPFRGDDSLEIVQDAVAHHHAYGVKVYPPSGYRPIHNQIPSRPVALFSSVPGRQWDGRYAHLDAAELDHRLEALLAWCEEAQVPVFVHCSTGEFEARKGYGRLMAHPKWWLQYLQAHPAKDGGPCRLRLCLGHAGGPDFWFGGGSDADWGRTVFDICTTYPNVYCEVGVHTEIMEQEKLAAFVSTVSGLFSATDQPTKDRPYPLSGKMMYGTDWFMPGPVDHPSDYLEAYQVAFLDPRLRGYYKRFFLDNAIHYLDIEARLARQEFPPPVRSRLEQIVHASRERGEKGTPGAAVGSP